MLGDKRIEDLFTIRLQVLMRARLVLSREAGLANHISGQNGGKAVFHTCNPPYRRLATAKRKPNGPKGL